MSSSYYGIVLLLCGIILLNGCEREKHIEDGVDLTVTRYEPVPYEVDVPDFFPPMPIVESNPLTEAGVLLGRQLFYDPILSRDSTISCASCHKQHLAFTDGLPKSIGIDGRMADRSSMSLVNLAWVEADGALFWDGRVATLEELSLHPIQDAREMDETLPSVINKLKEHPRYPSLFRSAFGITNSSQINAELLVKALAQFQRIIISANSKIDRNLFWQTEFLSGDELDGSLMLFEEGGGVFEDAECRHCHNPHIFYTNNSFSHNGIISIEESESNIGRALVTGKSADVGKFRVPTLRNIAVTGPYMHDGRIQTLEEVLDHYLSGGHAHPNRDPLLAFLKTDTNFSDEHKAAMIKALHAFTDSTLLTNPEYANPFE